MGDAPSYKEPAYAWRTPADALRRPSQSLGGRNRLAGPGGPRRGRPPQDVRSDEQVWEYVTERLAGDDAFREGLIKAWGGLPRGRTPFTRNQQSVIRAHLLSAIPNLNTAEAMNTGFVKEGAARKLVRAGKATRGREANLEPATKADIARIDAERKADRARTDAELHDLWRLVGRLVVEEDTGSRVLLEAVDNFIDGTLSDS